MVLLTDIVDTDIPLVIGLYGLLRKRLLGNYIKILLEIAILEQEQSVSMKMKLDHCYFEYSSKEVLFRNTKVQRMHFHFLHPKVYKLFAQISRPVPCEATPIMYDALQLISQSWKDCETCPGSPLRFKASLPADRVILNHKRALDPGQLDGDPFLLFLDSHTNLNSKSASDIWDAFVTFWSSIFGGYAGVLKIY